MKYEYVQVGVTAHKLPNGKWAKSVPLWVKAEHLETSGISHGYDEAMSGMASFFVEKINQEKLANAP